MNTITLDEIRRDPTACLDRVLGGETLVILDPVRPVAEIRPLALPGAEPRPYGLAAGEFTAPDDFDAPLPEAVVRQFEGR